MPFGVPEEHRGAIIGLELGETVMNSRTDGIECYEVSPDGKILGSPDALVYVASFPGRSNNRQGNVATGVWASHGLHGSNPALQKSPVVYTCGVPFYRAYDVLRQSSAACKAL